MDEARQESGLDRLSRRIDRWAARAGAWAGRHWMLAPLLAVAGTLLLAMTAPLLHTAGQERLAHLLYRLFGFICHQRPERTLTLAGQPMAFCARDTGLYAGMALAFTLGVAGRRVRLPAGLAVVGVLPLALDGGSQLLGLRESTNTLRLLSGGLAGLAVGLYVISRLRMMNGNRDER